MTCNHSRMRLGQIRYEVKGSPLESKVCNLILIAMWIKVDKGGYVEGKTATGWILLPHIYTYTHIILFVAYWRGILKNLWGFYVVNNYWFVIVRWHSTKKNH